MTLAFPNQARAATRGLALTSLLALCAGSALAEPVTLISTDGTINLEGNLISVVDGYYILQTELGDLRVASDLVRCEGAGCPDAAVIEADIAIAGSDVVAEGLMPLLMAGFATHTDAEIAVSTTSTAGEFVATLIGQQGFGEKMGAVRVSSTSDDDAFAALLDGTTQVALSDRRILPSEARALSAAGAGNMIDPAQEHIVAVDSLVVIVNPQNPVTQITLEDLGRIYAGEVTNWNQVGGPDLAIEIVGQPGGGTTEVFKAGVYGEEAPEALAADFAAGDNTEAAIHVGQNLGAIAYVGYAFKRGQKPLDVISSCGIGTSPDAFSVKTEEYALFRRLYMYQRGDARADLTDELMAFIESDTASTVIRQSGFIDLSVERVAMGLESPRAERLAQSGSDPFEAAIERQVLELMADHDRLSTTFRFRTGSTQLDPRAERDLLRLAAYLETLPAGSEVTFVGFADSVGAFEPNLELSAGRAGQIAQRLRDMGGAASQLQINSLGVGEVAPAACNDSDQGRTINRRVETWVKVPA